MDDSASLHERHKRARATAAADGARDASHEESSTVSPWRRPDVFPKKPEGRNTATWRADNLGRATRRNWCAAADEDGWLHSIWFGLPRTSILSPLPRHPKCAKLGDSTTASSTC